MWGGGCSRKRSFGEVAGLRGVESVGFEIVGYLLQVGICLYDFFAKVAAPCIIACGKVFIGQREDAGCQYGGVHGAVDTGCCHGYARRHLQ